MTAVASSEAPSASGGPTGRAVWFEEQNRAALRDEPVPHPRDDQLTVRAKASLISQGTELQVYRGQISVDTDLGLETCAGTFAFPVKYAYQVVGEVEEAGKETPFKPGDLVFARHPHQELFTMRYNPELVFRLPDGMDPEVAVFANLADVSYNALLDVPVRIGDAVLVFGQGIVGTFTALFARKTAGRLIVVDPLADRRRRALELGADSAIAPDEIADTVARLTNGRGVDIAFEASSAPPALQQAIDATGQEGTVCVISYYGTRPVTLTLAPSFHFRRHRIVSSQVSSMGSGLQPRWDFERRMDVVLEEIQKLPLKEFVTHRFDISEAPRAYEFVDARANETLGVVFTYGH
jgi:2-desacetyl-2-hydroxyethyl bacteriochlorophyllide A dehydrogenase